LHWAEKLFDSVRSRRLSTVRDGQKQNPHPRRHTLCSHSLD